ncbi:MAG: hypothetical protein JWO82_3217 [Akkermansiaceae bacterium]|nr:hypothetical protein [Akkermansiaceae bacterium]
MHRAAAAGVAAVWSSVALVKADPSTAVVVVAVLALPVACIWFPEALAGDREKGGRRRWSGRGEVPDQECPPPFLRWAGWFVLLWVPLLIFAAGWMES